MDQMHEIDLELNDLRNIYLLPAPLWHCTFAFTHDFLSLAQFLRVLRERCGILHSTANVINSDANPDVAINIYRCICSRSREQNETF